MEWIIFISGILLLSIVGSAVSYRSGYLNGLRDARRVVLETRIRTVDGTRTRAQFVIDVARRISGLADERAADED